MTYFNGAEACITWEEPGQVVTQGKGHARCYPFRTEEARHPVRSDAAVRLLMTAGTDKRRVKGFKGRSGLLSLKGFDLVRGVVPDYMHGTLLGVTKTLMYKWFSSTESGKDYFVGNKLKEISKRLQNIKPIENIERLPMDIEKNYRNFKATELQAWLLFYAVPCLLGILPEDHLDHFASLSEGVFLLLGDNITPENINRAKFLLDSFYQNFCYFYPLGSCGLNVHNIGAHLVDCVRDWGPLWAWSCFAFDDGNAVLLQSVHGTGNVTKQLMRVRQAKVFLRTLDVGQPNSDTSKWKKLQEKENCLTAGCFQSVAEDKFSETVLRTLSVTNLMGVKKVSRVLTYDGQRLYAEEYSRMKKRECSVVLLRNGKVASIKYFAICLDSNIVYAVLNLYRVEERHVMNGLSTGLQMIPICSTEETNCVLIQEIAERLVLIRTNADGVQNLFVSRLPNSHGRSVFK